MSWRSEKRQTVVEVIAMMDFVEVEGVEEREGGEGKMKREKEGAAE